MYPSISSNIIYCDPSRADQLSAPRELRPSGKVKHRLIQVAYLDSVSAAKRDI